MEGLLYFAFGALNVILLYLFTNLYRKETKIDLLPGRATGDKLETIACHISYFVSGPFGTVLVIILGAFLYEMWKENYRNKK